ncbi:Beclin-1 [Gonapodya sp. JEL0774]|nr:Beclin-1 [Gonapodya sp. JEL0774]
MLDSAVLGLEDSHANFTGNYNYDFVSSREADLENTLGSRYAMAVSSLSNIDLRGGSTHLGLGTAGVSGAGTGDGPSSGGGAGYRTTGGGTAGHSAQADSFIMLSRSAAVLPHSHHPSSRQHLSSHINLADSSSSLRAGASPNTQNHPSPHPPPASSLSHRLRVAQRLFDIMSARSSSSSSSSLDSPVDHPLCQDCADMLLHKLEKKLAEANEELEKYTGFLAELDGIAGEPVGTGTAADSGQLTSSISGHFETPAESQRIEEEIAMLYAAERQSLASLAEIAAKNDKLRAEIARLELEGKAVDEAEENYWRDLTSHQLESLQFASDRDSVMYAVEHAQRQLERLQRTNVYNDTFRIWHEGQFGTINGFRLGRLPPSQPVDWSEINAALGQTLLLLYTLAKKLNFKFKTYKLIPNGSFSRIERIEGEKAVYEFFGSDNNSLTRLFVYRRFDNALLAFLNCLQQLGESLEKDDPNFKLPYRISKDKIGDTPIRLQFNDEQWTKALKYVLIDIKWISTLFY